MLTCCLAVPINRQVLLGLDSPEEVQDLVDATVCAHLAYETDPRQSLQENYANVKHTLASVQYTKVDVSQSRYAPRYIIAQSTRKVVFVCVRGSWEHEDWYYNVNYGGPHVNIHQGFSDIASYIPVVLFKQLVRGGGGGHNDRIVFAGHSMGGPVASLSAEALAIHLKLPVGSPIVSCYTFGAPVSSGGGIVLRHKLINYFRDKGTYYPRVDTCKNMYYIMYFYLY